jgi:hypothetical protein
MASFGIIGHQMSKLGMKILQNKRTKHKLHKKIKGFLFCLVLGGLIF